MSWENYGDSCLTPFIINISTGFPGTIISGLKKWEIVELIYFPICIAQEFMIFFSFLRVSSHKHTLPKNRLQWGTTAHHDNFGNMEIWVYIIP